MLLLAVIGSWAYGFYQLLRLVVCGSPAYLAFKSLKRDSQSWAWVMVGVALLFNPVIPVRFTRDDRRVFDLIAAGVFGATLWTNESPSERLNRQRSALHLLFHRGRRPDGAE